MRDDELSAINLELAPLKSSVGLSLWAMSHNDSYERLSDIIGTDYTMDAVAVHTPQNNNLYNVKLTVNSISRNFSDTVVCFEKNKHKDLSYGSAASLIHLLKMEHKNVAAYEGRSSLYVPYNTPLVKGLDLITTDHIYREFSEEEDDNGAINFRGDTDEANLIYQDLSRVLKNNGDLTDTTRDHLKSFLRTNKDSQYVGIAQAFAINVSSLQHRYMPTDATRKRDQKEQERLQEERRQKGDIDPHGAPRDYPANKNETKPILALPEWPALYATYVIGSGRAQFMGHVGGVQRAMDFIGDINEFIIQDHFRENPHHRNKRSKHPFLCSLYKEQMRSWDLASAIPLETTKDRTKTELPFPKNNLLFSN